MKHMLEKLLNIRREKVEWENIVSEEGINKFIKCLYENYPLAERIYQGNHGGGIPIPSSLLKYFDSKRCPGGGGPRIGGGHGS